jgi:polyribonucleotide nucleotidyltransferase
MYHNIIKDAVQLDKEARDQLKALKDQKAGLDEVINKTQSDLEATMKTEIKSAYQAQKKQYESEIASRRETALKTYEDALKALADQYYEHKSEWIEEIFKAIVE